MVLLFCHAGIWVDGWEESQLFPVTYIVFVYLHTYFRLAFAEIENSKRKFKLFFYSRQKSVSLSVFQIMFIKESI